MYKVAAIALSSAVAIAGLVQARPAEAHACPPVVIAPLGYVPAYHEPIYYAPAGFVPYYARGRYWHRGFDRDRFEHFHRDRFEHWDRR